MWYVQFMDAYTYAYTNLFVLHTHNMICIKTHDSELQGQEEVAIICNNVRNKNYTTTEWVIYKENCLENSLTHHIQ